MEVQETENVAEFKQRFDNFVNEFISKSQNHCIITREKATRILRVLKEDPSVDDPQLKFYVKQKQFQLRDFPQLKLRNVLCVPTSSARKNSSRANQGMFGKYHRVALKDEFFNIIYEIHTQEGSSKHLGIRSTIQEINRHHAHIPRALILNFIKMCPLCSQSFNELHLLSSGDLSQSSTENNDNQFPEESFADIKPNIQLLSEVVSPNHFASGQDQFPTFSPSGQPYVTPLQYSPAPPPSATQWSNSLHQENMDSTDQEIIDANHFMAVGKVSIIDIQELLNLSSPPRRYTCLVHYIDLWSKYSVLWPLRLRDVEELAFGIAKNVFAYFGSPKQIIYDTNFDDAQQLEESLRKWSKQVKVTIGLQEPLASSGPVHWKIVEKLKELLVESWEVKLSKLQYISNTKLVTTHGHISPYKAVIGNDPMTEAFSELADKYNFYHDSLHPNFLSTSMHNNIPNETNLNSVNELAGFSVYPRSTPTISNVCHINLTNSPVISSSGASGHQMAPTQTACTVDVCNSTTNMTNQMAPTIIEQKLSHNYGPVSSSMDLYPSSGSQVTTVDVHSQDRTKMVANNGDHANHLIYIDDDDEDDDDGNDTKNIPLIEGFSSTAQSSDTENPTEEHPVESSGPKNILLGDFSSNVQPLTSPNFTTQPEIVDNDTKNILLIEDFNSAEQPSTSQNSAEVETDQSVTSWIRHHETRYFNSGQHQLTSPKTKCSKKQSSTERMRLYRARLKQNPELYAQYKAKECQRMRVVRARSREKKKRALMEKFASRHPKYYVQKYSKRPDVSDLAQQEETTSFHKLERNRIHVNSGNQMLSNQSFSPIGGIGETFTLNHDITNNDFLQPKNSSQISGNMAHTEEDLFHLPLSHEPTRYMKKV